jgi:hypothetical protein
MMLTYVDQTSSNQKPILLTKDYVMGEPFSLNITANNGKVYVKFNDALKAKYNAKGTLFFKFGCYLQSKNIGAECEGYYPLTF